MNDGPRYGRLRLDGDLSEFHRALNYLAADTCDKGRCEPGSTDRCGKHLQRAELWFPGQQDPIGRYASWAGYYAEPDPTRYVVWVDAGRTRPGQVRGERKIRMGLHLVVCRNGAP